MVIFLLRGAYWGAFLVCFFDLCSLSCPLQKPHDGMIFPACEMCVRVFMWVDGLRAVVSYLSQKPISF